MSNIAELDIRCNNCGALVTQDPGGAISSCAYCGAKYRISANREANDKFDPENMVTCENVVTPSTLAKHRQFRIDVKNFRGVLWLAMVLYLGVLGVGWMVSRVSVGGPALLSFLIALFAIAIVGRLHPKPPSFMARLSIWSFGNLFPMGVIWGLLINSGVVAILLARGVPLKTETFPSGNTTSTGTAMSSSTNTDKTNETSVNGDYTCDTLPKTHGWFGFHSALVLQQDWSEAIVQLQDDAGHLFVLGKSVVLAHTDSDETIRFSYIKNADGSVLPRVDMPAAVVRESNGRIQFTVAAGKTTIAILFYSGKDRRLVLVNVVTGKAAKPIILPGSTEGNVSRPFVAATSDTYGIVWRARKNILGFVISEEGRIKSRIRLKDSVDTSEPRIAWNGAKFGIAYERSAPANLPTGEGLFEFSANDRKPSSGKMICAMGKGWSSSHDFHPKGEMLWHDGAYHLAGSLSTAHDSSPQTAILHFTEVNGTAGVEICKKY